jgi:hypothetical protein
MAIVILILLYLGVVFGLPIVFVVRGVRRRKTDPNTAMFYYILAVVYVLVSGGICVTMMT